MSKVKRRYESSHRQDLAEQTRQKIAASARELFGVKGYEQTTIVEIARHAEVAVPTVYASFGEKRAIVLRLLGTIEAVADSSGLHSMLTEPGREPRAQLRAFIDFSMRLLIGAADLIRIAELAGKANQDVATVWNMSQDRRRETCRRLVESLLRSGALRDGLAADRAIDILWVLASPEIYSLLAMNHQWSPEALCDWLYGVAEAQLLAPPRSRARSGRTRPAPREATP
jgi:AcrR family transcriptional regulator